MRIGLAGVGRIGAFHARTLADIADSVVVTDADRARAEDVATRLGLGTAGSVPELLGAGIDGLVVATSTATHPELVREAVRAGLPVFCEKPVAPDVAGTLELIGAAGTVPVQVGFQRRFDPGYGAAREAAASGALGWIHTIRSTTLDAAPPPAGYIPGSGGIFRDCAVHDFDSIRWVTGHEVTEVYAAGANRGEDFFREAGDVDTASALLTLDDDTLALVSCTRYNAAGYDVRLEVLGSDGSVSAGLDERMPVRSAHPGVTFPAGPAWPGFLDRFRDAYRAELTAFTEVVAGSAEVPCTMRDALEALYIAEASELSRRRRAPVRVAEIRETAAREAPARQPGVRA
jgi:myo-inositol 2-dehydrogenase / D-chiro-inositol 1-dehydrogenase